jgi:NADH-quinone oxidoreductase subunit E
MARLTAENELIAREVIGRYPVPKSALIPLCHLAQEQDGHLTESAMEHIAELVGVTPAEVLGTASFYEMLKRHEMGRYAVNICHGIACHLVGADDLIHHAEATLGVKAGGTTPDGLITLEAVECIAACTEAPCLQVNYRYAHNVSHADLDRLVADLRGGRRPEIPDHGTLAKVRQHIPADRAAGNAAPDGGTEPGWLARNAAATGGAA